MAVEHLIDLTPEQLTLLRGLLREHLPGVEVWAYGSRVKGNARRYSDLDLVVIAGEGQGGRVSMLREVFEESNLPFRVDCFVWDEVPEAFREAIRAQHVVVVRGQ
jgi:predicted nucleotidyltransferase